MTRLQSSRSRARRGQALVEFALVLPLLAVLLFAIIEFARVWNAKQLLTDATREGARLAVVGDASPKSEEQIEARIREIVARGGFDASEDVLDIVWTGFDGASGTITTVEATLPFAWKVLPGLVRILTFGSVALPPSLTLHSFARMRNE